MKSALEMDCNELKEWERVERMNVEEKRSENKGKRLHKGLFFCLLRTIPLEKADLWLLHTRQSLGRERTVHHLQRIK